MKSLLPRSPSVALALLACLSTGPAQTTQKLELNFAAVEAMAIEAAKSPWAPVNDDSLLPKALHGLTYDQHRNIRFKPESQLWSEEGLPFRVALFHPGYLFKMPVAMNEFTETHVQKLRFARSLFDYTNSGVDPAQLPADLGYAGFRLHHPLNHPETYDELAVFLGASYYRMLGKNMIYGLSARGLALDTGLDKPEEFPVFTQAWLGKPKPGAKSITLYTLLNSPSVAGAYEFVITPGEETVCRVRTTLIFRQAVTQIGISPLTSMYWFGENVRHAYDDFRPEVHDSDGLVMKTETGEVLWRPLQNDPQRKNIYSFSARNVRGFGLVQRDRDFSNYEDLEARYDERPGVWVEPDGYWGPGSVKLVELPTAHELSDNIVAFWEPESHPKPGEPYRLAYTQRWTLDGNPAGASGYAVATRSGIHEWAPGVRFIIVDFAGKTLEAMDEKLAPEAVITTSDPAVEIMHPTVQKNPRNQTWRVAFQIKAKEGVNPVPTGAELRCTLRRGEDFLTETWTCRMPL